MLGFLARCLVAFSPALLVTDALAEVRDPRGVAVIVGNKAHEHERLSAARHAHRDADVLRGHVVGVPGHDPENVVDLRDAGWADMESAFANVRSHEGKLWRYPDPKSGSDAVVSHSGHGAPGLRDRQWHLPPADGDPDTAEVDDLKARYRAGKAALPDRCLASQPGPLAGGAFGARVPRRVRGPAQT